MANYPQLSTGAIAQFPIEKQIVRRCAINRLPGGSQVKMADLEQRSTSLELRYLGLTGSEREAIEAFFDLCEGRLRRFTFLDPTMNLLRWSEDLTETVWTLGGFVQAVGGADDPYGGSRGTRLTNGAQTSQGISQTLDVQGSFTYCFSLWIRATAPCAVTLSLSNADGEVSISRNAGTEWARVECSGAIPGDADELTAKLTLPAGTAADVYGLQVEAQPCASDYRQTDERCGVRTNCRFASDELTFTAHGVDDHAATVQLIAHEGASQ